MRHAFAARTIAAGVVLAVAATAADAKCTRLAFSVNDYGKEGPTKDAMKLLDTYIAKWMAERGIKKYSTGKKSVSCELFLDFGVFDEHTCKAEASVCWGDGGGATTAAVPASAAAPIASVTPNEPAAKKAKPVKAAVPKAKAAPTAAEPATPTSPAARPPAPKAKTAQPT